MFSTAQTISQEIILKPGMIFNRNRPVVTFRVVTGNEANDVDYPPMSYQHYFSLVTNLIDNGRAEKKIGKVIAFELTKLAIQTEQDNRAAETTQGVLAPSKAILFDPTYFSVRDALDTMAAVFKVYGRQMTSAAVCNALNKGQLVDAVVSSVGIWTVDLNKFHAKQSRGEGFKGDYVRTGEPFVYETLPGTGRIVASHLGATSTMFCNWDGGFKLRTGAGIATLFSDMPKLIAAVEQVKAEGATDDAIEKHLMVKSEKSGEMIAKFDVYGMFPAFREDNYRSITVADSLNDDGKAAVKALAEAGNHLAVAPAPKRSVGLSLVPRI